MKFMASSLAAVLSKLSSYTPPGVVMGLAAVFLGSTATTGSNSGKTTVVNLAWIQEFVGSLLMIGLTFSPGKWWGTSSTLSNWVCHAVGVVAADYIGGGPHVNPAVSVSMFALGKCDYTEMYVRIMGSMVAGLLAFPFFYFVSAALGVTSLGGPEYNLQDEEDDGVTGFLNEFFATFLLMAAIYALNFELHFGEWHYWIKQTLTAVVIRYLIVVFPLSGPAINPMLGTSWAVFAENDSANVGVHFPADPEHYIVYWAGPVLGGLSATFLYAIYIGGTFFGYKVPVGPIKNQAPTPNNKAEGKKD